MGDDSDRRTLGATLRVARTRRALSLVDVAEHTKLSPTVLRFMESDRFAQLPGGIITRGYLRAYAGFVGLDPEAIVGRYRAECEPPADDPPPPADRYAAASARLRGLTALAVLVAGATAVIVVLMNRDERVVRPRSALLDSTPIVATETLLIPSPSVAVLGAPLQLVINPTGDCWISIVIDGDQAFEGIVSADSPLRLRAWNVFELRVGAPALFAYTLNGVPGRALGTGDDPVSIEISAENYRDFLVPLRDAILGT
jgi:cytoskeletal protein RodZ